jgi:hypothetical protein
MSKPSYCRAWAFAVLPLFIGCGADTNLVGDWEAMENGARLVEFRFSADNRVAIIEFTPGKRVVPAAGLQTLENTSPIRAPGAAAVSQFQYALDCRTNPCRLQLSGIGTDAGIELVYLVRFLTSQELELKLLARPPARPGFVQIGPEILILRRLR